MKEDGATKNDCKRNASERLLKDFRREYPYLPVILVEDALASNGPHLKLLEELKWDESNTILLKLLKNYGKNVE